MDIIIENARVLTLDDDDTEYPEADILIRDGRIQALGPGAARGHGGAARVIDGRGKLAMPGLINGHFHSPMNLFKGALVDMPLELYMLFEVPPLAETAASRELAHTRTQLAAVDLLRQGVTAIHDDVFYVPVPTDEEIDGVMSGYADSGIRATATINQSNVVEYAKYPYLAELLPPELRQRMDAAPRVEADAMLALYERYIGQWEGSHGGRIRTAVSCSAPQRVTPEYFRALGELSRRHGIPYQMHILETKLQRVLGREKFGQSLIRYAHEQGVLDERAVVIHAIWIDDADIELLARSGCSVAHNPISNLKIGSGVMPFRRLREAGVNLCLGIDEVPVDDGMNLWTVGKVAGLIHKISDPEYRMVYGSWWGVVGLVPLGTGLVGWCPAYLPFGFSTCAVKNRAV